MECTHLVEGVLADVKSINADLVSIGIKVLTCLTRVCVLDLILHRRKLHNKLHCFLDGISFVPRAAGCLQDVKSLRIFAGTPLMQPADKNRITSSRSHNTCAHDNEPPHVPSIDKSKGFCLM